MTDADSSLYLRLSRGKYCRLGRFAGICRSTHDFRESHTIDTLGIATQHMARFWSIIHMLKPRTIDQPLAPEYETLEAGRLRKNLEQWIMGIFFP